MHILLRPKIPFGVFRGLATPVSELFGSIRQMSFAADRTHATDVLRALAERELDIEGGW